MHTVSKGEDGDGGTVGNEREKEWERRDTVSETGLDMGFLDAGGSASPASLPLGPVSLAQRLRLVVPLRFLLQLLLAHLGPLALFLRLPPLRELLVPLQLLVL